MEQKKDKTCILKKRYRFEWFRWEKERQDGSRQIDSPRPPKRSHPVPIDDASNGSSRKRLRDMKSFEDKEENMAEDEESNISEEEETIDGVVTVVASRPKYVEVLPPSPPRRTNRETQTTEHQISDGDENEKVTIDRFVTIALKVESVELTPTITTRHNNAATEFSQHPVSDRDDNGQGNIEGFVTIAVSLESDELIPTTRSPDRRTNGAAETTEHQTVKSDVFRQSSQLCEQTDVTTQPTRVYRQRSVATQPNRLSILDLLEAWE